MQITIHRGSQEVGGNCVEVQSGESRMVIDVGLPLFDASREPIDTFALRRMSKRELAESGVLPRVSGLFDGNPQPNAILLSHAHLDHTGLLDHTQNQIPIYASRGTSKMMLAGKLFAGQVELPRGRFREIEPGSPIEIGNFQVTGYPVDHSIFGCLAFLIEAKGKTLLYTGDLRLHGRKPGMMKNLVAALRDRPIDAMLMEGTHLGFPDGHAVSEYELEDEIVEYVRTATSLVLASFSPQHVDRLVAFIRASKKTGRTFVTDFYTAVVLYLLGHETSVPVPGTDNSIRVYFPQNFVGTAKEQSLSRLVERFRSDQIEMEEIQNSPEKFVMVHRPSLNDDFSQDFPLGTVCLYSCWPGYLDHAAWQRTKDLLEKNQGQILEVHTSGHMFAKDIVPFVQQIQPKQIIPIHTFEPGQFQDHFTNATLAEDGVPFNIE